MAKLARDVMTPDPACCSPTTTLDQVAKMMVQNNCGEIPVVDMSDRPIGVITDRDIVCRVVAEGMNPMAHTVESYMTSSVITVSADASIDEVPIMEDHQIRRCRWWTGRDVAPASSPRPTSSHSNRRISRPRCSGRSRATPATLPAEARRARRQSIVIRRDAASRDVWLRNRLERQRVS